MTKEEIKASGEKVLRYRSMLSPASAALPNVQDMADELARLERVSGADENIEQLRRDWKFLISFTEWKVLERRLQEQVSILERARGTENERIERIRVSRRQLDLYSHAGVGPQMLGFIQSEVAEIQSLEPGDIDPNLEEGWVRLEAQIRNEHQ